MIKKWLKYILIVLIAGFLVYKSVYFKKLDTKITVVAEKEIDPAAYAQAFWKNRFVNYMDSAVEMNTFSKMLKDSQDVAFARYAKTQGLGNASCFLLKGEGIISEVKDDYVVVATKSESGQANVKLNTGLYFGNAVRDVTGLISMGNFSNTMDYNAVSSELNKIVQKEVIAPFKTKAVKGSIIQFVGCAEIKKEQKNTDNIELLPVQIIYKY